MIRTRTYEMHDIELTWEDIWALFDDKEAEWIDHEVTDKGITFKVGYDKDEEITNAHKNSKRD